MSSQTPQEPNPDIVDGEVVPESAPVSSVPTTTPAPPASPTPGYVPPVTDPNYSASGVPTFDFVRDKIENRISTAIGSKELAEGGPEGQQVDEMMRKRDEAAKKKLDEIRKSMGR
ncbi:PspA domain-containing protein [Gordonia insulae]|uniref:35 kDa protein n=1 Tax=Gordonia insulae TaxID=2420509 RepID=A0A3G8JFJ4_9ACTN|nr:PspA domain-containing protein [Gordonia insulae]AZG43856.1 35 kDa protein [Gordonia insulae]